MYSQAYLLVALRNALYVQFNLMRFIEELKIAEMTVVAQPVGCGTSLCVVYLLQPGRCG